MKEIACGADRCWRSLTTRNPGPLSIGRQRPRMQPDRNWPRRIPTWPWLNPHCKRYQNLYDKKSVSPQEFDEVKARYQAALAHRDMTQAGQAQAKAALAQAHTSFSYTRIVAPFDGVITEKKADPGTLATRVFRYLPSKAWVTIGWKPRSTKTICDSCGWDSRCRWSWTHCEIRN